MHFCIFRYNVSLYLLHILPTLLCSFCGITSSAVRMMVAVSSASTPFTLPSSGGFSRSFFATAAANFRPMYRSVVRYCRSKCGLSTVHTRRLRAKGPRSLTGAATMLWSKIGRKHAAAVLSRRGRVPIVLSREHESICFPCSGPLKVYFMCHSYGN